ncbi:MAG: hypothetical protein WCS71_05300 [Sphaerochaetaceae bacterium]
MDLRSIASMMDDRHGFNAPYDWDLSCTPDIEFLTITVEDVRMVIGYAGSDVYQLPGYTWSWEEWGNGHWSDAGKYGWDQTYDLVLSHIDDFLNASL